MSGIPLRSTVRLAFTAVPRVYAAARRAGAGPADAAGVVVSSAIALTRAAGDSPRQWRRQNATRHFAWQAWLTARYGVDLARAVAAGQERGSADPVDSAVDCRNNLAGQEYGAEHTVELTDMGRWTAVRHLVRVAVRLFDDGGLAAGPRPGS